jgi:uncharacterized protein
MDENIFHITKNIRDTFLENGIPKISILLFGSRARGDYDEDSDYDFLILTRNNLTGKEKQKVRGEIRKKLIMEKKIKPIDILIKSIDEYDEEKNIIGNLYFDIKNEGKICD